MTIHPTHECFDDAVTWCNEVPRHELITADPAVIYICHGICTDADGRPFAHGWIEDTVSYADGPIAWQSGVDDKRGLIWFATLVSDFRAVYGVQQVTRYSPRLHDELSRHHGKSGPWRRDYVALTRPVAGDLPHEAHVRGQHAEQRMIVMPRTTPLVHT